MIPDIPGIVPGTRAISRIENMPIYLLSPKLQFPPPHLASSEGLLAVGGDLSTKRLLLAYAMGIFPWYSEGEPIMWWSPDPRLVLYPADLHVSRSLARVIRKATFHITMDTAFTEVIRACSDIRSQSGEGTWIVAEMVEAYCRLHEQGYAHSVEAWLDGRLVGGLYGVSLGRCFFGESMFSRVSNASKVAFVALVRFLRQHRYAFIDCQVNTRHLIRFGAADISRTEFLDQLQLALQPPTMRGRWNTYGSEVD